MEYLIVSTTIDNKKDAKRLARKIILAKLGACAQISKIKSYYKWKGKIEFNEEFKIEIKTLSKNYKKLENFIIKNHKYEVPEIISIKIIKGYKNYLNWIK
ncbi:divalent-cation tolerance protein CutA [Candidatus Pacearchaeota archaeon]|nr:divalent-cation tolerance protein CutA [Candidatus Pacearchaeota archaeon]